MREKIIRDPVHDVIAFRVDDPAEKLLFDLLNADEFQRLRRIRQLGLASLAYPGADHSRYSHSLGVMETARKMLEMLGRHVEIDPGERTATLVAALLHDLGHGPFSHVFERVSGIEHERLTARVVMEPASRVHQLLIRHDASLPETVVRLLNCTHPNRLLCDIISSQLDADRLDYLLRDNLMTGSRYGRFDLRWLLQGMEVSPGTGRLVIGMKAVSAAEAYLQARYHMYRNVYFHKVVRAAEGMLRLALQRAKRLMMQERLPWPPRESNVFKAMTGQRLTIAEFVDLDDVSILQCFKLWIGGPDATLSRLCRGLLYRELFKTIDITHADDPQTVFDRAATAVKEAGGDGEYDLFYDDPADTPYQLDPGTGLKVRTADGQVIDFAEVSPLVAGLGRQTVFRRIHVSADYRDVVSRIR